MKIKFTNYKKSLITGFLFFSLLALISCNEDPTPSLLDLIGPSGSNPQITSIEPPNEALAGVTKVVINGSNFSADTSVNLVFFGTTRAKVLEASANRLVVLAPNVLGDSLTIKVAAEGDLYSNKVQYSLRPAVSIYYTEFQDFEKPHAITIDENGNLYVSLEGRGTKKIDTNLELLDYAPKGSETYWSSMKLGPSNTIYSARLSRGVWQVFENTQPTSAPWAITPTGTRIDDIDFDANLNIWGGGGGNSNVIIMIKPDGSFKTFPFQANVRSVRVFNNNLYVGGNKDGSEGVWSFPIISSDSIGASSLYYNVSQNYSGASVNAITFSADGDLYIGSTVNTNNPAAIITVHPDKTSEELYAGLIKTSLVNDANSGANPDIEAFAWGTDNFLYFTQRGFTIFKLDMQKLGAPHYGRD